MIDGIFLGMMTFVGFSVMYNRLPTGAQIFAQKHPLLTDVVCAVFFYQVMGMTITAHFAVAAMSMLTMAGLHVARHKEDFVFLYDAVDLMKRKASEIMSSLKEKCVELNAANRAAKLNRSVIDVTEC